MMRMIRTRQKTLVEMRAENQRIKAADRAERRSVIAASFDYSKLDSETARIARHAAERVKASQKQVGKTLIAIGAELLKVKARLDHGSFGPWLQAEFNWDERTAQRYMGAAEAFGGKSDTVSELPPTMIYALASPSTPPAVRDEIVRKLDSGERLDPATIRDSIAEARAKTRQEQSRSRLTPDEKRRAEAREKRAAKQEEKNQVRWITESKARTAALEKAAALIVATFGKELPALLELLTAASETNFVWRIEVAASR